MLNVLQAFITGWKDAGCKRQPPECVREDKCMRESMSESQVDKMLKDTFPASDPPSTY